LRQRGERVERSFAHLYETGGLRRTHLRGHPNILKRLLIHVGAFNLSLVLRKKLGAGTPRGLAALKKVLWCSLERFFEAFGAVLRRCRPSCAKDRASLRSSVALPSDSLRWPGLLKTAISATGC
jgi:transposase